MIPTDNVVHPLINGRTNPASFLACYYDFRNLEGREIAQAELYKFTFLMELIEGLQSFCKWYRTIRSMQVEDVDAVRP